MAFNHQNSYVFPFFDLLDFSIQKVKKKTMGHFFDDEVFSFINFCSLVVYLELMLYLLFDLCAHLQEILLVKSAVLKRFIKVFQGAMDYGSQSIGSDGFFHLIGLFDTENVMLVKIDGVADIRGQRGR